MTEKTFNLKGLSFNKEDLDIINLDDLGKHQICPGHIIFISSKFNKPVLLMRAGDFVDPDFITRYKAKGQKSFYMFNISNQDNVDKLQNLWIKLKTARLEFEKLEARRELLKYFANQYWFQNKSSCSLDFFISTFNIFNRLDEEIIVEIRETDTLLCERSVQAAAFSSIIALALGYTDMKLISDIFHITFLLDYGLIGPNYSYFIAQACEKERVLPGSGLAFLKNTKVQPGEIAMFENHPLLGKKLADEKAFGAFFNVGVTEVISYHHEFFDGKGFPRKINYWGLSEFDAIPILVDAMTPFKDVIYTAETGGGILKELMEGIGLDEKLNLLPIKKVYSHTVFEMNKALIDKEVKKAEETDSEIEIASDENAEDENDLMDKLGA